jgi:glutamate N-acetyltransferase / amino-acid N-acetyltransferase
VIPKRPVYVPPSSDFGIAEIAGLRAAGVAAGIKASGAPDVALLVADAAVDVAGVFATNAFPAAPVVVSREHLAKTGGRAAAVVINAGNANACTGARGLEDARLMAAATAKLVGCAPEEVLVCSTGVIGVQLPRDKVLAGIEAAFRRLESGPAASSAFGDAIRTTDAFAKNASLTAEDGADSFHVAGVCKGAGMIEPNMATMLAFVATDLAVSSHDLGSIVRAAADKSFNVLHVDTHASTNDTFLVLATGKGPKVPLDHAEGAVADVARRLAWLIARDGEGATKVTTIQVTGAPSAGAAREIARRIAASALCRTALFGNDPNWGRFVSAAGNSPYVSHPARLVCAVQGVVVFEEGEPTAFDRKALATAMKQDDVTVAVDLADGDAGAEVLTSDLGYEYIEINAEYTT